MASMYEKVVAVISKVPSIRTEGEVEGLLPWFIKKSELFASLKPGKSVIHCKYFGRPFRTY